MANKIQVVTSIERRRKWHERDKLAILKEAESSGNVSATAKKHKIPPSQIYIWRKQLGHKSGQLTRELGHERVQINERHYMTSKEPITIDYSGFEAKISRLEQLLGRKTVELEFLREQFTDYLKKNGDCSRPIDPLTNTPLVRF